MPSKPAHRLERRSQLLATRLKERVEAMTNALAPPGQRPPFTTTMTKNAALDWWAKNRYSDVGKMALSRYTPDQIAELDATLARRNQAALEQPTAADVAPPLEAA